MASRPIHLPIVIDIPKPCDASWYDMDGNERERRCARCEKQVHHLSALTHDEIAELVKRKNVCISLEISAAGELVTREPQARGGRSQASKVMLAAALTALAACHSERQVSELIAQDVLAASASANTSSSASATSASTNVSPGTSALAAAPIVTGLPTASQSPPPSPSAAAKPTSSQSPKPVRKNRSQIIGKLEPDF